MSLNSSFYADAQTYVRCHTYGTVHPPILALDDPGGCLSISAFESTPIAEHRDFAGALVEAVTAYAAAVEQWASARTVDLTKAA